MDVAHDVFTPEGFRCLNIFVLRRDLLIQLVTDCMAHNQYSFRHNILQDRKDALHFRAYVWDGYAARIDTIESYYRRSMELLRPEIRMELFAPQRPIFAKENDSPSSYMDGSCVNSLIADGCDIQGTVKKLHPVPGRPHRAGGRRGGLHPVQGHRGPPGRRPAGRYHRQIRHRAGGAHPDGPRELSPGGGPGRHDLKYDTRSSGGDHMNILYITSEAAPFCKTGGLADVLGSLPPAVAAEGDHTAVLLPLYSQIAQRWREKMNFRCYIYVDLGWRHEYCGLFSLEYRGVTWYFADNERYFRRRGLYGDMDDGERFAFFSKAAVALLPHLAEYPNVVHCNDWQTALVPVYLRDAGNDLPVVFTIHNVEYQGKYGPRDCGGPVRPEPGLVRRRHPADGRVREPDEGGHAHRQCRYHRQPHLRRPAPRPGLCLRPGAGGAPDRL